MECKTLVLCDDYWHPAALIQQGLSTLQEHGFQFDWLENARDWSALYMNTYPLVILSKSNNISSTEQSPWMTEEIENAFADYVRQGKGLLAIHSGTAGYEEAPILRNLLGGVFRYHPEQCSVTFEPVSSHPLTTGAVRFTAQDEHYFMSITNPEIDVFLKANSIHGEQPAGWRLQEGKGRVAVLTPGHTLEVWQQPAFQTLIRNCARWCTEGDFRTN